MTTLLISNLSEEFYARNLVSITVMKLSDTPYVLEPKVVSRNLGIRCKPVLGVPLSKRVIEKVT